MKISERMSRNPCTLKADQSALHAAQILEKEGIGSVPVHDGERLIGMVTDRDLVVRVMAKKQDPNKVKLSDVIGGEIRYCFDDEDCDDVARNMDELLVRRLPVMNREKRLVGIVSLDDLRPRKPH